MNVTGSSRVLQREVPVEDVDRLLKRCRAGDEQACEDLYTRIYGELRDLATRYMRRQPAGHTLEPSALVHEAYLKMLDSGLVEFADRAHFLATAAKAMRWVLVDHAKGKRRLKRGHGQERVPLEQITVGYEEQVIDILALDEALRLLGTFDAQAACVVEMRFFAGLSVKETAEVLGCSPRQVERDWTSARAWLRGQLE